MFLRLLFSIVLSLGFYILPAQEKTIWLDNQSDVSLYGTIDIATKQSRLVKLDTLEILSILRNALKESEIRPSQSQTILSVPTPDGDFHQFRIVSYAMMEPGIASRYPGIMTFKGISLDRPGETIRLDWTHFGFHALVRTRNGSYYIDPYNRSTKELYQVYHKSDAPPQPFECHVDGSDKLMDDGSIKAMPFGKSYGDCQFRSYRLAQATTGEYSNFHGATSPAQSGLVLSAVTTVVNRVNDVYERDMTVRLILINNTDDVFYYNPATDPYTNNNGGTMLGQNQATCDNVIGTANYDIGHVFSTGGGGVANLRAPCNSNLKARGVTGLGNPVGDPFSIDYVAHEMGHQFGGNHTQNNSCNRNNATAMEPGSASTIMGYAGICSPNVQNNSDDYMHAVNLQEIASFVTGNGNSCATIIPMSNSAPVIDPSPSHTIPAGTPFVLEVEASDAEDNFLSYCWEQFDNQTGFPMPPASTSTGGPMFRSLDPSFEVPRYFPNLPAVVAGTTPTWEVVPTVSRSMNFTLTVRDNNEIAGCVSNTQSTITSITSAGPFVVQAPNTNLTLTRGQQYRVQWDVAGTDQAPIFCTEVDIFISTNGGQSFNLQLAEGVPNNGYHFVTMPMVLSNQCRIMVKCNNGIFYDLSNQNFSLVAGTQGFSLGADPAYISACVPSTVVAEIDVVALSGFSGSVFLSIQNLPAGVSASFGTNPLPVGQSTQATFNGLESLGNGLQELTLLGQSGSLTETIPLLFFLSGGGASATLDSPFNGQQDVSPVTDLAFNSTGAAVFFNVEISFDPNFNNLLGSFPTTSSPFAVPMPLDGETTYYWRVQPVADCGAGSFSDVFSFTTSACEQYQSTNVPIFIEATSINTVTSTLNISSNGTIQDVNVMELTGQHTWINDLTIRLISPQGTVVTLFEQICGNEDNFFVSFDDQASLTNLPCPPTNGSTYQPAQSLSAFNGENMMGNWTLEIEDAALEDGGQLQAWELQICAEGLTFLPVEWLSFEASINKLSQSADLVWDVSFSEESDKFIIERSIGDAINFKEVQILYDRRSDEYETRFNFNDREIPTNIPIYYRIKQIDLDGQFVYSPIRQVMLAKDGQVTVFPNPINQRLFISTQAGSDIDIAELTDMNGRILARISLREGEAIHTIETEHLAPGMYLLKVRGAETETNFKIVK